MGRSEFVGERNGNWDDDPDYFQPRLIQRQPATPSMSVQIEGRIAKFVTKNPISYLSYEEVLDLQQALDDVIEFLQSH